jgi:hypothetical protein
LGRAFHLAPRKLLSNHSHQVVVTVVTLKDLDQLDVG